jgi:hypothetical protein
MDIKFLKENKVSISLELELSDAQVKQIAQALEATGDHRPTSIITVLRALQSQLPGIIEPLLGENWSSVGVTVDEGGNISTHVPEIRAKKQADAKVVSDNEAAASAKALAEKKRIEELEARIAALEGK